MLLEPVHLGVGALGCGAPLAPRKPHGVEERRRALGILGLLVLLVSSNEPVANALQWRLEHAAPSTYRSDVTYDNVAICSAGSSTSA